MSRSIKGTIGETYLERRGLVVPPDTPLRFLGKCWHWPTATSLAAILAPIVGIESNRLIGLHQTFIAADGSDKAAVEQERLYLGRKKNGVVKLTPDTEVTMGLAIGEGIETCMTALNAGYATWSCLDAGNLGAFPVLAGIESLSILVDNDDAGIEAAAATAQRWRSAGREVRRARVRDAKEGGDWNDRLIDLENGHG